MTIWPYQDSPYLASKLSLKSLWLSVLTFILGAFISVVLWYALTLQARNNVSSIITVETEHLTKDIQNQLELRISALKHMAKHLEMIQIINYQAWQETAANYLNDYAGFKAIAWVGSDLKTQWTAPVNNAATLNIFNRFVRHYQLQIHNINSLNPTWVSPLVVLGDNNTKGYFVVIPIAKTKTLSDGYLMSFINAKDLFNIQVNTNDFSVAIFDGNQQIFQYGPPLNLQANAHMVSTNINALGEEWALFIQPSQRLVDSFSTSLPWITLLLGLIISALFAITIRLVQMSKERTLSLYQINEDLKNEIRDREHAEDTKQKLEKALLQGQKLQAIGTLAGGIAHDFNNILYAIKGYTEMAREDNIHDETTHKNLGKVIEAVKRGQDLVSRILTFSRRHHHEFKPVMLSEVVEGVLGLLKPTIPASVSLIYINSLPMNFMLNGNTTQLHQVFVNLINNAVDAMDGEGSLCIEITPIPADDELLQQLKDKASSNYCKIDISDTGHGMDEGTMARIFEPFFTTKEVGKGTGLGLATVHAIINEHQGEIMVASQLGIGTTFTILLPEYVHETESDKETSNGEYITR